MISYEMRELGKAKKGCAESKGGAVVVNVRWLIWKI